MTVQINVGILRPQSLCFERTKLWWHELCESRCRSQPMPDSSKGVQVPNRASFLQLLDSPAKTPWGFAWKSTTLHESQLLFLGGRAMRWLHRVVSRIWDAFQKFGFGDVSLQDSGVCETLQHSLGGLGVGDAGYACTIGLELGKWKSARLKHLQFRRLQHAQSTCCDFGDPFLRHLCRLRRLCRQTWRKLLCGTYLLISLQLRCFGSIMFAWCLGI